MKVYLLIQQLTSQGRLDTVMAVYYNRQKAESRAEELLKLETDRVAKEEIAWDKTAYYYVKESELIE